MSKQLDSWAATRALIKLRNQAPPLKPIETTENHFPLSLSQERLWALEQLNPEQPLFNLPYAFQLNGPLNIPALNQALEALITRQPVLRTMFQVINGQLRQVVQPVRPFQLQPIDLSGQPTEQVRATIIAELNRPFNLTQKPPFRVRLYSLGQDEYVIGLTVHHIIYDYWSKSLFFKELNHCYGAYLNQTELALKPLPVHYTDYAAWQRKWLTQPEVLEFFLGYWYPQLQGLHQPDLPVENGSTKATSREMAQLPVSLSAEAVKRLKGIAKQNKVQLFTVLLTALKLVIAEYLKTSDVAIFSPVTNRHRPEFQHLMGDFSNPLILRTDLAGEFTITELLQRVGQTVSGAIAYQDLPLQLIKAGIPLKLPQISFSYLNTPQQTLVLPHLVIESWDLASGTDDFDLLLYMMESQDELSGFLKYNRNRFTGERIAGLIEQFRATLIRIVEAPTQSINLSFEVAAYPTNITESDITALATRLRHDLQSQSESNLRVKLEQQPDNQAEILQQYLQTEIGRMVGRQPAFNEDFLALGLDSLSLITLTNRLNSELNVEFPPTVAFEYSTIENLTTFLIENLKQPSNSSSFITIQPGNRPGDHPASYVHQLYYPWYQAGLKQGEGRYQHISTPFHILSEVDSNLIAQAFQQIVNRHDALRSNFVMKEEVLIHRVQAEQKLDFQCIDASTWNREQLNQRLHEESQQPFDLAQDPIFRVRLFHISSMEYVLLLTMHHIAVDGLSLTTIIDEFKTIYAALSSKQIPYLSPVYSLVDYTLWQNQMLDSPIGEKLATYWQEQINRPLPSSINFLTDYPNPTIYSHKGKVYSFQFGADVTRKLVTFVKQEGITLYALCLAAFQLLLHHLTQQEIILVGSLTSNRIRAEFSKMVACLVDEILIPADFSVDLTIQNFLHQVKANSLEAIKHQGYPWFILRQQVLDKGYMMNTIASPAFFALHNIDEQGELGELLMPGNAYQAQWGELLVQSYELSRMEVLGEVWSDFYLDINLGSDNMFGHLRYNHSVFKPSTIAEFMHKYQNLLINLINNLNKNLSQVLKVI